MKSYKNYLFAGIGLVILLGSFVLSIPRATQGQGGSADSPKLVKVVNMTTEPVPVSGSISGSVNVTNTPNVRIDNTPAISIVPGASVGINQSNNTVQLANTTANPLPVVVSNDARQPFQSSVASVQTDTNVSTITIATVPAGKRLVIEFISVTGQVPAGQHVVALQINTTAPPFGGFTHDLLVNEQRSSVNGDALFRASQPVRLYADPGSEVRALLTRNNSAGAGQFSLTISGHLVDVP